MRSDKKDYQLLAEAYATVQEREQLDEFAGFGTGGMGDKLLKRMPTFSKFLPGNMAGKASARVDTASFVKQNIQPVFDQLTQSLGERDQVDLGQVADIVGNAYGVDPDSLKAFSKYQQNGQITGTLPVAQARDLLFTAATDASGVAASKRYAQRQGGASGYTPVNQQQQQTVPQQNQQQQQTVPQQNQQQQQTVPQQNQQQPGPDENGAWAQPKDGIARTVGKFGLNAARKIGGAALNKMRNFNADMEADAQKATDATNAADTETQEDQTSEPPSMTDLAKIPAEDGSQEDQSGIEQSLKGFGDAVAAGAEDKISEYVTRISNGEDINTVTAGLPPAMKAEVEKRIQNNASSTSNDVEEVEAEPISPTVTEPSTGDGAQTNVVDVGDQQQSQVDNKNEIEPSVITPPAPQQNPQLPNNTEDEEEDPNKKQLPTLREQYIRPLGGCGFMRNNWGNFNK